MSLFDRRIRGFRVVEIGAVACLLVLVLAVYLNKAGAGRERAKIDAVQAQIDQERDKVRLLNAEVAHLEQPERIEAMATQYLGLAATPAKHEIAPDSLPVVVEEAKKPVKQAAQARVVNMQPFPTQTAQPIAAPDVPVPAPVESPPQ